MNGRSQDWNIGTRHTSLACKNMKISMRRASGRSAATFSVETPRVSEKVYVTKRRTRSRSTRGNVTDKLVRRVHLSDALDRRSISDENCHFTEHDGCEHRADELDHDRIRHLIFRHGRIVAIAYRCEVVAAQ